MPEPVYALSIKQPWAALVVHGLKRVEIRRWRAYRTGPILIHAAGQPDRRPEPWAKVPADLLPATELRGGIIGSVRLIGVREYRCPEEFSRDISLHLNERSWFRPPLLFGFEFAEPCVLPFRPYPGWVRFFRIEGIDG